MAQTFPISLSKPKTESNGNIMDEVVMMATVEEPCAVFSKAAIIKGINIPNPEKVEISSA